MRSGPVCVLVEHGGVLLLGGDDADLASELEGALDHVVGDDVQLLLLLALQVGTSSQNRIFRHPNPRHQEETKCKRCVLSSYLHVDAATTTLIADHASD